MKKRLPKENRRANFLACNSSTGMYKNDNIKQRKPKNKHMPNPMKRCVRL